jgi:kynurenine formamidase
MANNSSAKWIFLSYPLAQDTPAYGGGEEFVNHVVKSIESGDSCNTSRWDFANHLGTHIDFPRHFSVAGSTVDNYQAEDFVFTKLGFIDLGDVPLGTIISPADIPLAELPRDIEMLILKTWFCSKRSEPIYSKQNPGFSPDLAEVLRNKFLNLRLLAFDSISVSSFAHRELGRKAHSAFLCHERPILLLEDMDLSKLSTCSNIIQVIVAPLRVEGADGSPCTVMANIQQDL